MRNLLVFKLEIDFGEDVILIANNEKDLELHLNENFGFTDIKFRDVHEYYGTCDVKDQYGINTAKCFYAKHI